MSFITEASGKVKLAAAIIGVVSGVFSFLVSLYLFPEVQLKRIKAFDEIEKSEPRFVVRYNSVDLGNPLASLIKSPNTDEGSHPLVSARKITTKNTDYYIPFSEPVSDLKIHFPDFEIRGGGFNCFHHVFYFQYVGLFRLEGAVFNFELKENFDGRNWNSRFGYLVGPSSNPNHSIQIGDINEGDQFIIPIALECSNSRFRQVYKQIISPSNFEFHIPALNKDGSFDVRKAYSNPTVDYAGILGRG